MTRTLGGLKEGWLGSESSFSMPVSSKITPFDSSNNDDPESPLLSEGNAHLGITRSRSTSLPAEKQASPHLSPPGYGAADASIPLETMGTSTDPLGAEVIGTVRGATYKLFRFHLHDWLALLVLVVLDGALNIISPFYRFVGSSMMANLMYPMQSNTVPIPVIPVIAIVIPLVIFVAFFLYTMDITDLHHATLGLLFAVFITAVLTDAMKDAVGRPRPDFFWRCFPDGIAVYNNSTGNVICHGEHAVIKEGYKSFPSGHTSWSFAGLGFLSLYLAGKLQLFNGRGHVAKVAVVFTPLLAAMLVGLSRVDDYWHHWQDVFAGALLGLVMAALCYLEFFPSIFRENSTGPYSHLEIGNDFKLGFFSLFRHQPPEEYPPLRNGQDHDLEGSIR